MESALTAAEVAKVELPLAQNLKVVINFHVTLYERVEGPRVWVARTGDELTN